MMEWFTVVYNTVAIYMITFGMVAGCSGSLLVALFVFRNAVRHYINTGKITLDSDIDIFDFRQLLNRKSDKWVATDALLVFCTFGFVFCLVALIWPALVIVAIPIVPTILYARAKRKKVAFLQSLKGGAT